MLISDLHHPAPTIIKEFNNIKYNTFTEYEKDPDSMKKEKLDILNFMDFPGGSDGKNICLQCRRPGFDP